MKQICEKFMTNVESKIGNSKQVICDVNNSDVIYISAFDDELGVGDNALTCGE